MSKKKLLYFEKNSKQENFEGGDILLSPSFYWTKKVKIASKSKKQLLSMAPSVFAGALPSGEFRYKVMYLFDDEWLVIAYDKEKIKTILQNKKYSKVYIAQEIASNFSDSVFKTPQNRYLCTVDGIVVELDALYVEKEEALSLENFLSKFTYKDALNLGDMQNEVIDKGSFYKLLSVAIVFILAFGVSVFSTYLQTKQIKDKKVTLLQKSGLPQTSFQRKSILAPLKKKNEKIKQQKKLMASLEKLSLEDKKSLQEIKLERDILHLSFKEKINKKRFQKLFNSIKFSKNDTIIRISL